MGTIKVLSEAVINKIAAGEIIERPGSAVKELVENSLDANATSIAVTVRHGGKELIRVTDNGTGMSPDDAADSLKRYATSKIETVEDIFSIRSFGFRGEALPSIAAVSRLTLLTRAAGASVGTEVTVNGGALESIREAGIAPGTTVEAAQLFFNTPARRKFLRSERAELVFVAEVLTTAALGNPAVDFKLYKDKNLMAEYPACMSLRERIAQIHDEEVTAGLIPLQTTAEAVRISGFITAPHVNRVNRSGQYFFINNRPIRSPGLSFALHQGYGEALPHSRFPLAFLFLEIDSARVDVNAHPTKREVRIANEREVQKALIDAIQHTLHTGRQFPFLRVTEAPTRGEDSPPGWKPGDRGPALYPEASGPFAPHLVSDAGPQARYGAEEKETGFPSALPRQEEVIAQIRGGASTLRVLGQFHSTYIVAEQEGTLFIIDQHAAHERIIYEEFLRMAEGVTAPAQLSLIPLTFTLDYREQEVLEEYLPLLKSLGFGINNLGRNTYSLDATPALLETQNPKQLVLDFLHDTAATSFPRTFEDKRKALAASLACKTKAVKGASHLVLEKMTELTKRLFQTQNPFTCPHGRPTCIVLPLNDLEKQFGRK
jgi:DNA mismatch repair protein MutL